MLYTNLDCIWINIRLWSPRHHRDHGILHEGDKDKDQVSEHPHVDGLHVAHPGETTQINIDIPMHRIMFWIWSEKIPDLSQLGPNFGSPSRNVLKLIWKSPRFVPLCANLTHFGQTGDPWHTGTTEEIDNRLVPSESISIYWLLSIAARTQVRHLRVKFNQDGSVNSSDLMKVLEFILL